MHRVLALLNFAAFLSILIMDWGEMPLLKQAGFLVGAGGNLACFFFWKKWEKWIYPLVYTLDAVLYAAEGYGLHEHGSRRAFAFFYAIAGVFLIRALSWSWLRKRFPSRHF
jgi:hypothetical protein